MFTNQSCFLPPMCIHFNGRFKNRCAHDTFNCLKRNPCFPSQCTTGVDIYNGIGPTHYVTCDGLACQEEFCPEGETYDEANSQCTGKNSELRILFNTTMKIYTYSQDQILTKIVNTIMKVIKKWY